MGFLMNSLAVVLALIVLPYYLPDSPITQDVNKLPEEAQTWYKQGQLTSINGYKVFSIYKKCSNPKVVDPPTFVLIHGFPSSSYDYHKVLDGLLSKGDVFMHDHIGFGFSDKPVQNFTYSLVEAADNCLATWKMFGLKKAHVVSHDMGDSILTEILARRHINMLPDYFSNFFESITFTNGGMKYSMINFRIGQRMMSSSLGPYFSMVNSKLGLSRVFSSQLKSIWGPNSDHDEMMKEIALITALNDYKGGTKIMHKLIYYLWDRAHFEFRWFSALSEMDVPVRFIWSDSDAVSPLSIPRFFQSFVPGAKFEIVQDAGHFYMLEKPKEWLLKITDILN
ncbi:putative hydrolase LipZ isoform X2 [Ciona intestinalis]